jgi:hypothetical protein
MMPPLRRSLFNIFFLAVLVMGAGNDGGLGFGFDLKYSYGTVAISYANGTLQEIARVDSGPQYQDTIRRLSLWSSEHDA